MKKLSTLILTLFVFLGANAGNHEVSNASELKNAIQQDPTGYIKLSTDIDLSGITESIANTFKGTIDGMETDEKGDTIAFHALTGGTGKNRVKKPIFKSLDGATLKNLIISNFRIEWDDDCVGAVASTAKNSIFNNIIISGVSIFNDDDEAGAIVGKAEKCDFRRVKGMGNDVTVDGNRVGGFVGISYNSIYCDCSNSAYSTVYADGSWGNAYAGGFVGESNSDQFVFCINFAPVGALDDRIGGIVGYANKSTFNNCTNSGFVMHCEEDDFLSTTKKMKNELSNKLKDENFLKEIQADLKKQYGKQEFSLTAGFISFIGTLGLSTVSFGVELCLLSIATGGIGAFTVTIIIMATGIVVSLINLIDAEIGAHDEMGGICGTCEGTVFDCCTNYGTLMCRDSYVGGIVGLMRELSKNRITNCLNAGEIQGYEYAGGICGEGNPADIITHCLNVGKITVPSDGKKDPIGNISRDGSIYALSKCYYLAEKDGDEKDGRIPASASKLSSGEIAKSLNDGATGDGAPWKQTVGTDTYPVLDPSHESVNPLKNPDVFVISSVEDLNALRTAVNSGSGTRNSYVVYITEDIDCNGTTWEPIGTKEHKFKGICYGGGHTISNLNTAENKDMEGVGFFGVVDIDTEVRDLFIGSGTISGNVGVGAIIGCANHGEQTKGYINIIGCGNKATITGSYDCGGLVGAIYSDDYMKLTLDNCYNMGSVNATERSAALCGFAKKNALVTSCWNTGSVKGYVAGKGFVRGDDAAAPEIHNCYVAGDLSYLLQSGVGTFTEADAKNGTLCLKLNGGSNDASVGQPWEQDITKNTIPTPVVGMDTKRAIYTSRNVTNIYGTIILPYTVQSNDDIRFYTLTNVTGNNTDPKLEFSAVDTLLAGTPAIFYVNDSLLAKKNSVVCEFVSISETFSDTYNNIINGDWTMTGNLDRNGNNKVISQADALKTTYYISGNNLTNANTSLTIAPFRAYLTGPSSKQLKSIGISFNDGSITTDMQFIPVETEEDGTVTLGIFNMAGQRLDSPQPGLNIIDGNVVYFE